MKDPASTPIAISGSIESLAMVNAKVVNATAKRMTIFDVLSLRIRYFNQCAHNEGLFLINILSSEAGSRTLLLFAIGLEGS